jgi:hypothetical protein
MINKADSGSCCGEGLVMIKERMPDINRRPVETYWNRGTIDTPSGKVLRVTTELARQDILDTWKARWAINLRQ